MNESPPEPLAAGSGDPAHLLEVGAPQPGPAPSGPAQGRRRSRTLVAVAVVGAVVLALLVAGAYGLVAAQRRPHSAATAATAPTTGAGADRDQQQLDALTTLLATRRTAVLSHDRAAWLSTVDPHGGRFRDQQAAVFDHLGRVPFADWTYQYVGRAPDLSTQRVAQLGGEVWVARVLAGYRLRGYDTTTSYAEQYLTLVRRGTGWFLASTSDGGTAPQPWDLGAVGVVRGQRVLVLGTAPQATLRTYAQAGDRAIARVSAVWGRSWSQRAVLVAPRTQAEFGQLLLRGQDGLDQVAAVTTGDLGGGQSADGQDTGGAQRAGNDRVVVNPAAFARLGATGRRVVLTHEMTHVAVRQSTTSPVPIWLSEGFADFVGYRGTGVSQRVGAGDLLVQVRAGHAPTALPSAADFDPTRTTIAPSYSAAWLACSLIADTYGTDRLVALYRRAATAPADGGPSAPDAQLAAAFPKVLGVSEVQFTAQWRRYVDHLARA